MASTVDLLAQVALFAAAGSDELASLAASSWPRRLSRGQVLFTAGEPSEHLFVVADGRLKVLVSSERGETLVLRLLGPGDALGELSILDRQPRSASVEAVDDTQLVCVPATAVRKLLASSPATCLAVAEQLAGLLRALTESTADLVFLDLPRRLAKLLTGARDERASQADLAAQLGVTRPTLNRALQSFQRRGWVEVSRGRVAVLDAAALLGFAAS